MCFNYTITITNWLSIYTSMKHSMPLTKTISPCASLFRHPVWCYNKSICASLLIKTMSISNPSLACLVLLLSVVNNFILITSFKLQLSSCNYCVYCIWILSNKLDLKPETSFYCIMNQYSTGLFVSYSWKNPISRKYFYSSLH